MKALFRMVFGRKGHKGCASRRDEYALRASDERRVTSDELAVENHQTAKRPNHQTGLSNHQTTKLPNHQTGLARWAAVAAVAAGAWLEGAREAEVAA